MRKPLKDRPNGQMEYLLKRIPLDLWKACQMKARHEDPPLSMRWVLTGLLWKYQQGHISTVGKKIFPEEAQKMLMERRSSRKTKFGIAPRKVGDLTLARLKKDPRKRKTTAPDIGDCF